MNVCKLENCVENIHSLGLCYKHYQKDYHDKHKDRKREYDREFRLKNLEILQKRRYDYYRKNKEKVLEYGKLHFQRNKEYIYARTNRWRRNHPEKIIQYWLNHLNKYSKPFKINSRKFGWLLTLWAKNVRKRDNNKCQICGRIEDIHAHHLFHKEDHPKLALNKNNGITLCRYHHMESHGRTAIFN